MRRKKDRVYSRKREGDKEKMEAMNVGPWVTRVTSEDRYEFPVLLLATNSYVSLAFSSVFAHAYLCKYIYLRILAVRISISMYYI